MTMMRPRTRAGGLVAALCLVATPLPAASDEALEAAQEADTIFSQALRQTLQAALVDGGPIAAIDVCRREAPRIAEEVMQRYGVRLGRVALPGRNRNPAQAAEGWQLEALRGFQAAADAGERVDAQRVVLRDGLPEGTALRLIRAIATEPGCLACHGPTITPELTEAIRQRYPGDQATGFEVGDLRGALWVEVPTRR